MGKKLAIQGHTTRGREVIELLKMMGGKNIYNLTGTKEIWYILSNTTIEHSEYLFDEKGFTLEEFLEKYPFKVGDVIKFPNNMLEEIAEMKWDENSEDILCTSTSGCTRLLRAHLENPKSNKQKETIMRYKVGDKVKIKSLDWYNKNKDKRGHVDYGKHLFYFIMSQYCGKIFTISNVYSDYYLMSENKYEYRWTDEMIEGLVEEEPNQENVETKIESTGFVQMGKNVSVNINNANYEDEVELQLEDYEIVVRDGKTYAVRKKPKYPKTYAECCDILHIETNRIIEYDDCLGYRDITQYDINLLTQLRCFRKIRICRDAYWKIAGEELGLDEPWKPDMSKDEFSYAISYQFRYVQKNEIRYKNAILVFPTKEMRDTFYDNFKEEIENCKELL